MMQDTAALSLNGRVDVPAFEPLESRLLLAVSGLVHAGIDGHLMYDPDAMGDRIPDFSTVGYRGGTVAIPDVPVQVTVRAGAGDDTARVQSAIDQVAAMPIGEDGFRGAVLLKQGHYDINGQIRITAGHGDCNRLFSEPGLGHHHLVFRMQQGPRRG